MIKKMHYFLVLILFLVSGSLSVVPAQVPEQLYFENFTVDDGLPGNFVRDITQDSLGYIWLATELGIAKYDGYEFEIYRSIPGEPTSISDDDVFSIFTDIYGTVWVKGFIGLDRYDPATNSFIRYFQDPSSPEYIEPGEGTKVIPTGSGSLFIGTVGGGLVSYHLATNTFKRYRHDPEDQSSISSDTILDLEEDQEGTIWFITENTGLNKFDPATETFTTITFDESDPNRIPTGRKPRRLFVDNDQILWVDYASIDLIGNENSTTGSDSGIWQMNLKTGVYKNLLYDPIDQPLTGSLFSPLESENRTVWFGRSGQQRFNPGLYGYSKKDGSYKRYTYSASDINSLSSNNVEVVYEDNEGTLWVGTRMGLSKADVSRKQLRSFSPLPADLKAPENNLGQIQYAGNNRYWIARPDLPFVEWNQQTGEWRELDLNLNYDELGVAYYNRWVISNGLSWSIQLPDTLVSYNIRTKEINKYSGKPTGTSFYELYQIVPDKNNIWLSTNYGLSKFNLTDKNFTHYFLRSEFSPDDSLSVNNTFSGKDGNIWTMTIDVSLDSTKEKQGILLSSFDPESETFSNLTIDENYLGTLAHGYARGFMEDSAGDLWISKSNGLVHYDRSEEHFTWYNQNDGLSSLFVNYTAEDESGKIWIATIYGLSRFDPQTKVFRNFERSDGIAPLATSTLQILNGLVFLTGSGGMNIIDPSDIGEYSNPPEVLITGITIEGKNLESEIRVEDLKKIEIPQGDSGLEIEYTSINFKAADKTTYAYKLEGLHEEFQNSNNRRYAQFTNLDPGDYTFLVRATNAAGLSSETDTELAITILPPWWRSWWAYTIYGLLFLGGVFVTDRVQRRRVLYKEKERARDKELKQAREIEEAYQQLEKSHENLKSAQDQLVQQEKLASLGQLTAGIAHEIKNPLNFVNNFSDVSLELVEEIRQEMRRMTADGGQEIPPLSRGDGIAEGDGRGVSNGGQDHDIILEILDDIEANLKTIHKHGSRADSIVKSMLQHSRGGDGVMEPTPLNPLIKEYINLAFHGMRAGENPINVDIDLQLDDSIEEMPLIAEDFSRVLLNLVNNAFDAMAEKQGSGCKVQGTGHKLERSDNPDPSGAKDAGGYEPKLTVRTKSSSNSVTIEIEDNGPGIPDEMKDKIMQPFFTTKKGTAGTGLGLSITNDIVKAHGGSIEIETVPDQFTRFKISLPA